jgi:ELWxxDGT repeat protein
MFAAQDGARGDALWTTDGTPAGTHVVKDIDLALPGSSDLSNLTAVNGLLFFTADDADQQPELWKSDGTAAGTEPVLTFATQVTPGDPFTNGAFGVQDLTAAGATLFFTAYEAGHGRQLWESDGTTSGTIPVTNLAADQTGGFQPTQLTSVNGTLFFTADDGIHGRELWALKGAAAGARQVEPIASAKGASNPSSLTAVAGTLYFTADDGVHGRELWMSDGTAAGTTTVADINPGSAGSSPSDLTGFEGDIFFTANDGVHGRQLWKSDGTSADTVLVTNFTISWAIPAELTPVNNTLFFTASDGQHGRELWKTDGTPAGTVLVRDINSVAAPANAGQTASSNPLHLTAVGATLYFTADDGVHGRELWRSDGTAQGTERLTDGVSGPTPTFGAGTVFTDGTTWLSVNHTLYFAADDGLHGFELWKLSAGGPPLPFVDLAALLIGSQAPGASLARLPSPLATFSTPGTASQTNAFPVLPASQTRWFGANGGLLSDTSLDSGADVHQANFPPPPMPVEGTSTADGLLLRATEGQDYSGVVATMASPANTKAGAQYRALIDWGDGTTTTTGAVHVHGNQVGVDGQHTYRHSGCFPVRVRVEVDGTPLGDAASTATVAPASPALKSPDSEGVEQMPEEEIGPSSRHSEDPDALASLSLAAALFASGAPFWVISETELTSAGHEEQD